MNDVQKPATAQTINPNDPAFVEKVAEFTSELVHVLTSTPDIPFPIIVQLLVSNAATICVYNGISRAQFMELTRITFSQIQSMNRQGMVKDEPKLVTEK